MARLTDVVRQTLATYWNVIYGRAYEGFTTTETVQFITDYTNAAGGTFSFNEGTATAVLYGYARRMYNAAQEVQSAQPEDVIAPQHISTPPWARDEAEMATLPMWHVHFDLTTVDEAGNVVTERKVSVFHDTLAGTFGELQTKIIADAQAMALKYGRQFVDASIMEIQSV